MKRKKTIRLLLIAILCSLACYLLISLFEFLPSKGDSLRLVWKGEQNEELFFRDDEPFASRFFEQDTVYHNQDSKLFHKSNCCPGISLNSPLSSSRLEDLILQVKDLHPCRKCYP